MKKKVEIIQAKIVPILKRYGVVKAAIFGSCARGEMKRTSDIDIAVKIKREISLLDFIGLKLEIEKALKRKVDLVEYSVIKPGILANVLQEQVVIL